MRMSERWWLVVVLLVAIAPLAVVAGATPEPASIEATGSVVGYQNVDGDLMAAFPLGKQLTAGVEYDSTTEDQRPLDATYGEYSDAPLTGWLASDTYSAQFESGFGNVLVRDTSEFDVLGVSATRTFGGLSGDGPIGLSGWTFDNVQIIVRGLPGILASDSLAVVGVEFDALVANPSGPTHFSINFQSGSSVGRIFMDVDTVTYSPPHDADGDGIEGEIDGRFPPGGGPFLNESGTFSDHFTDQHLTGTSFGRWIDRADLAPAITDLTAGGVAVAANEGAGTARLQACDNFILSLTELDAVELECGTLDYQVQRSLETVSTDFECAVLGSVRLEAPQGSDLRISGELDRNGNGTTDTGCEIENRTTSLQLELITDLGRFEIRGGRSFFVIPVDIDVQPGSEDNSININGKGVIPVAVLGSPSFDVSEIDESTLDFAGLNVKIKGNDAPQCEVRDVSGDFTDPKGSPDGYPDLVCHFIDDPESWVVGEGRAELTGRLLADFGGAPFAGGDTVNVVP